MLYPLTAKKKKVYTSVVRTKNRRFLKSIFRECFNHNLCKSKKSNFKIKSVKFFYALSHLDELMYSVAYQDVEMSYQVIHIHDISQGNGEAHLLSK